MTDPVELVGGHTRRDGGLDGVERLVARVDLKADRRAGVLRVRAAWGEPAAAAATEGGCDRVVTELAAELALLAGWLGLDGGVAVEPRGDLAAPLAAAVD